MWAFTLYQALGLKYLQQRRWMGRLCLLYKFLSSGQPSLIQHNLLPQMINSHRYLNNFYVFPCRLEYLKIFFFPYVINEWNKVNTDAHTSSNYQIFRNALLNVTLPFERETFNVNDST